jgi:hypothetical protein
MPNLVSGDSGKLECLTDEDVQIVIASNHEAGGKPTKLTKPRFGGCRREAARSLAPGL